MDWFRRQEKKTPSRPITADTVRRRVVFHGQVQGVGFRWQAANLARQMGLTGWVRNCDDGTVEMEVQGPGANLDEMLADIRRLRYVRVDRMEVSDIATVPEQEFRVTY
ncbi:MAG: acylphosphatase [Clostridiales bacterium]|nr:acylphosphatase [Clostridiales bacterium]